MIFGNAKKVKLRQLQGLILDQVITCYSLKRASGIVVGGLGVSLQRSRKYRALGNCIR